MVNPYMFTFDIGTNSIGWAAFRFRADGSVERLIDAGVRIFSDGRQPKDRTTLNATRRLHRLTARRLQRRSRQIAALARLLRSHALLPQRGEDAELLRKCPYELRASALDRPLTPHELGRVLLHLAKRRGYDSRRRFGENDPESSKVIGPRIEKLRQAFADTGARTLGEFLARRRKMGLRARFKDDAEFFPSRDMLRGEFAAIRRAQAQHHDLAPEQWERIEALTFFRRPLKPVEPGNCAFVEDEPRAPKALPSVQEMIFLDTLANLRLKPDPRHPRTERLSPEQVRLILDKSRDLDEVALKDIRKWIGAPAEAVFTIEVPRSGVRPRKCIPRDRLSPVMRRVFGDGWTVMSVAAREQLLEAAVLPREQDAAEALCGLGLSEEEADALLQVGLPDGHIAFGRTVVGCVLPHLRSGLDLSQALSAAGFEAAEVPREARLPYYGKVLKGYTQPVRRGGLCAEDERQFGRVANPTIHVVLNQLRLVVNALISQYGPPGRIVIETTRSLKLGAEKLRVEASRQTRREQDNKRYDAQAAEISADFSGSTRRERRRRLLMWERQGGVCLYSGQPISPAAALLGEVTEVDHVLPRSRTLDDSLHNLVLVFKTANQGKGNLPPWDAFPDRRDAIFERAQDLFAKKKISRELMRRIGPEGPAMLNDRDWLGRQLVETGYASKLARQYLGCLLPTQDILMVPGSLTAKLRDAAIALRPDEPNLKKSRDDHRHHALDAMMLGLVDLHLLQQANTRSARDEEIGKVLAVDPALVDAIAERLDRVVVSHKRDRGRPRSLFGVSEPGTTGEMHNQRYLKLQLAGDHVLRHQRGDAETLLKAIATGSNAYVEIYRRKDGSTKSEIISTFDANRIDSSSDGRSRPFQPNWVRREKRAHLLTRLFQGDTVCFEGGLWVVKEIVRKKTGNKLRLLRAEYALGFEDAEKTRPDLKTERVPESLFKAGMRLVNIDPIGRINVGHPPCRGSSTLESAAPA